MLQSLSPPKRMYRPSIDFISETIGRIQCLLYKKRTLVYIHVSSNYEYDTRCDVCIYYHYFYLFFIKSQSLLLFSFFSFFYFFFKPFLFLFSCMLLSAEQQAIRPKNQDTMMDELLQDLQPIIHYVALFIRLAQWKDTKYSLLLFLSLIIWWHLHLYILCLLPVVFILIKFQYNVLTDNNNSHKPQQQQQKQKDLIQDLTEIRNTLYLISSVKNWIQESDTLCRAYYQYYSISTSRKRFLILFGVTGVCAVVYVAWISLFYQQMITGASSLLWCFILIIMCLYCPWVYPIYVASVRAVSPLIYTLQQATSEEQDEEEDESKNEYVHGYCFEVYHHQRWWIPTGWCNLLLPQDLPLWYVSFFFIALMFFFNIK